MDQETGTASLKAKFPQKPTEMREEVLYEVSLDPRKAYSALDWGQCMGILVGYGVGPWTERTLQY